MPTMYEFENVASIHLPLRGDELGVSDRTLDFCENRWATMERNYMGTEWYCVGCGPDPECLESIRNSLVPIASLLGIELTDEVVRTNNPRSLLERKCKCIGEEKNPEHFIVAKIYELPNGTRIKLHLQWDYGFYK